MDIEIGRQRPGGPPIAVKLTEDGRTYEFVSVTDVDWLLLRGQKQLFLGMLDELAATAEPDAGVAKTVADSLQGILGLIDSLQDAAVDGLGHDERLVFGGDD